MAIEKKRETALHINISGKEVEQVDKFVYIGQMFVYITQMEAAKKNWTNLTSLWKNDQDRPRSHEAKKLQGTRRYEYTRR
jgi:hypothetical protein